MLIPFRLIKIASIIALFIAYALGSTIYVWTGGSDEHGTGSESNPFHTIQYALDNAIDGDIVIVKKGRYSGDGNFNLNFRGKQVTLQSENPDLSEYMKGTIIDAKGEGVIVRFINDECEKTIFAGFTLAPGDISAPIKRGIPGFFEFSQNACPKIRQICIEEGTTPKSIGPSTIKSDELEALTGIPPYGKRAWDGYNPFHQPAATTNYYGSGDANADGLVTIEDKILAQNMVSGIIPPSPRADIDGNGIIENSDISLLDDALSGGNLPAWWNKLVSIEQRNNWIDKFLSLDPTDNHPWLYWFQCGTFSLQTFIHGAFYRSDLFHTHHNGGQGYNIPIYAVNVSGPTFGHAINAILVGDDPLNFDHWRFIEPQNDGGASPGAWNMPYQSNITINIPESIAIGGFSNKNRVVFYVDTDGGSGYIWSLVNYNANLITTRPVPPQIIPDNHIDTWNPRALPYGKGTILFDRMRDDMTHVTDIHLADPPIGDPPTGQGGTSLILDNQYCRLMDIYIANDRSNHLIWKGKTDYIPGVYCGKLESNSRQITNVTRVASDMRYAENARIVISKSGIFHVFWLDIASNSSHIHDAGIYWSSGDGTQWQEPQLIIPIDRFGLSGYSYMAAKEWDGIRSPFQYVFDVIITNNNTIVLVVSDTEHKLQYCTYDGSWSTLFDIELSEVLGVDITIDSDDNVHAAYWKEGELLHRIYNGSSWSTAQIIANSGNPRLPRLKSRDNGDIFAIWEKEVDEDIVPCWNIYQNDSWGISEDLPVREGANAWYPTIEYLPEGKVVMAWSSRSDDRVCVETETRIISPIPEDLYISNVTINTKKDYYALNRIFAGPAVLLTDLASIMFVAGKEIHLKPGFHAEYGSFVKAYIDPDLQ